jgi:hypothetical protein
MNRFLKAVVTVTLVSTAALGADLSSSVMAGYKGGLSMRGGVMVSNFAQEFPLAMEFSIGRSWMDPGNPLLARKVFINDATDGTPEESGGQWDFRLDFLYRLKLANLSNLYVYAGVRHSMFTATFEFVGGNEFFDITTNQWGIGAGLRGWFPMGRSVDLTVAVGADQYFAAPIGGHDTTYGPDGEHVSPRQGYNYDSADEAVAQPKFQPVAMIGIAFRF